MYNLWFFWRLLLQNKNWWPFQFLMNQIFRQRFIIFDKWRYRSQLLLKLLSVEVATSFHWITLNSTVQYFEGSSQKKCLLKARTFGSLTRKWQPCKIFAKLNENHLLMANINKLHKNQTFGVMKMHNMCKIWLANNKFNLLRWTKKYFSWLFKGFQLPEIVSDPRLHL